MFQIFFDASILPSKNKYSKFSRSFKEWVIKFLTNSKSSESKTGSNKEPMTSWSMPNLTTLLTARSKSQSTLLNLNLCVVPTKLITLFTNWKGLSSDLSWKCAVSGDTVTKDLIFLQSWFKRKSQEKQAIHQQMSKVCSNLMINNWYRRRILSYVHNAAATTIAITFLKNI